MTGKTYFLYLGRGHGKEGIWIDDKRPESFLRKRDKFLEYFRKHVSSAQFDKLEMDSKDRIFAINYFKWGHVNKMLLFYNARNLYFAHFYFDPKDQLMKLFKSWNMKTDIMGAVINFSIFDEVGRLYLNKDDLANDVRKIESLLAAEKKLAVAGSVAGKSVRFYKRKKGKILQDLENIKQIDTLKILAEDERALVNLENKSVFNGVKLKFDSTDFYKRRNNIYNKIKKFKKAQNILELRLKDTEKALSGHSECEKINNLKTIPVVWKNQIDKKIEKNPVDKQYKLVDLDSIVLGIGQTAVGNDQLRTQWANKSDYWFHLDGDKSAHIIVKLREKHLDERIFKIVASALIEFSKFDYQQVNLVYTQVKNLKGVKGAPGKVLFKKEKRIQVNCVGAWRELFITN